jgi:DNA-binding transcriptional ArsR family regulator
MVEHTLQLDAIFHSLSDPIRRDILQRVAECELSIGDLAQKYNVSLAAISKHIRVLQEASLISKRREGKKHMVALAPGALKGADEYLEQYREMWQGRHDKLDALLKERE